MTFRITDLSIEQVNIILTGLGELPLKVSLDVFGVVRRQIDEQMQAPAAQPVDGHDAIDD